MSFFIKEENVRPGNRGGRDLFKWDDIRLLNNKDRESYLGVTQSIGFLDKGGKWRKRDWWLEFDPNKKSDREMMKMEQDLIRKEEDKMFQEMLNPNLKNKPVGKSAPSATPTENNSKAKLTDYEWKEMMKKK